jgi:hypothetical protein
VGQADLQDGEARAVHHDRQPRDVRLAGDEVEEARHRGLAVEHAVVEADVEDVGAALHLVARHLERLVVAVLEDEPAELLRAGDVGALADEDEVRLGRDGQRLVAAQPCVVRRAGRLSRSDAIHGSSDGRDVLGTGAAAAADQVEPAVPCELAQHRGHVLRRVIVLAELVRQPGVRVAGGEVRRQARQLLYVGAHVAGTERAVDADREQIGVLDRDLEGLEGLPRQGAPAAIRDRHRADDRHPPRAPRRTASRSRTGPPSC